LLPPVLLVVAMVEFAPVEHVAAGIVVFGVAIAVTLADAAPLIASREV
jgi:hypothetical protein